MTDTEDEESSFNAEAGLLFRRSSDVDDFDRLFAEFRNSLMDDLF